MKILLLISVLFVGIHSGVSTDHEGKYAYAVNTPNGPVSGEIILDKNAKGEYEGSITAYGQAFEITDIVLDKNSLSFKTAVSGYISTIKGKFEGNTYVATIYVEGIEIPLTAEKVK